MPITNPSNPKLKTVQEASAVPGSTSIVSLGTVLSSSVIAAKEFIIQPLPTNTGTIKFGWSATPVNVAPISSQFTADGTLYNLADLKIQATSTTDGILVTWVY